MPFVLTEEQTLLKRAAKSFCTDKAPIAQLRRLRDEQSTTGYDPDIWRQMVDLGWAGMTIPEEFGGLGFGYFGMGLVLEECGRTLTASPLLATVIGGDALIQGGSDIQKKTLLPKVAEGDLLLALALEEMVHHKPYGSITTAEKSSTGYRVSGAKRFVLDGTVADKLIVVARSFGVAGDRDGLSLVLVDRQANGVSVTRTQLADSRNAANIQFANAEGEILGAEGKAADILDHVLDTARVLLAAEMLGGLQECFERTIDYLKVREQFGVPIGSFQALKHRAALMFCQVELSKSIVMEALSALDAGSEGLAELASMAKAQVNDTYHLVSNEAIQMHGGIGMTDDFDIGFFAKRARISEHTWGASAFHRDRFAALQGY